MKLILSWLAASCLLHADFDAQHWQFRKRIQVENTAPISAFIADTSVYRDSRTRLRDVRIICADLEIPYRLKIMSESREDVELRPTFLDKSAVPHQGVQAVLDLHGHLQHNRLQIITGQKNFKEFVRIETSDNGQDWALVRNDGIIFNISQGDREVSDLLVEYPSSTRRYLRLTIPGWGNPAYLQSASLTYRKQTNAVRDVMSTLIPAVREDAKARTTSLLVDIGFEGLPYDRLEITTNSGWFSRDVEVFVSNDAKEWSFAGSGTLIRTAERTQLAVQIMEQWSRYVKLVIFNGDNSPVSARQVVLSGLRRVIQFPSMLLGSYWLYSGNSAAKETIYDFVRIESNTSNAVVVPLGKPEANPLYQAPAMPWTDRYPHLLYAVLLGSVVVMGYIIWRFLGKLRGIGIN